MIIAGKGGIQGSEWLTLLYRIPLIVPLRYDLTDTAGVLENKVLGMFHGLDD